MSASTRRGTVDGATDETDITDFFEKKKKNRKIQDHKFLNIDNKAISHVLMDNPNIRIKR